MFVSLPLYTASELGITQHEFRDQIIEAIHSTVVDNIIPTTSIVNRASSVYISDLDSTWILEGDTLTQPIVGCDVGKSVKLSSSVSNFRVDYANSFQDTYVPDSELLSNRCTIVISATNRRLFIFLLLNGKSYLICGIGEREYYIHPFTDADKGSNREIIFKSNGTALIRESMSFTTLKKYDIERDLYSIWGLNASRPSAMTVDINNQDLAFVSELEIRSDGEPPSVLSEYSGVYSSIKFDLTFFGTKIAIDNTEYVICSDFYVIRVE